MSVHKNDIVSVGMMLMSMNTNVSRTMCLNFISMNFIMFIGMIMKSISGNIRFRMGINY